VKTRKRELVRELLFSAIARPTSSERFVSSAITFGTISEEKTYQVILSSSLDAENAQNAPSFCISLVRSRDEIETKRKEACELTERFKEERETTSHTNLSLSLSASALLRCRSSCKGSLAQRERGFSSRCWSPSSQRGKRHAIRLKEKENRSVMV
jgi:hypothetical protein